MASTISGIQNEFGKKTEIMRINGTIKDNKAEIQRVYTYIGEAWFRAHGSEGGSEFAAQVQKILKLQEENAKLQDQIYDLQGLVKCTSCGSYVQKNSRFCNDCGAPMPVPEPPKTPGARICSSCGAEVKEGFRFCMKCGAKVVIPEPVKEEPAGFCTSCGSPLEPGIRFCTSCGTPIGGPEPTVQTDISQTARAETPAPELPDVIPYDQFAEQSAPEPSVPPKTDVPPEPAAPPAGVPVRICPNCGGKLADDDLFCPECGTRI